MDIYLSVIIPAYNEEKTIAKTLESILDYLSKQNFLSEIIVVSDGSQDKTAEIVGSFSNPGLGSNVANISVIDRKENRGKGYTVREGMLKAGGTIRLFMDADNSTSIVEFNKMIPYFKEGYEVVIGSRDVKGASMLPAQYFHKRWLGNLGNLIIQALLLPGIWDTQCGFKAFTAEAAKNIFSKDKIDRWGFDIETLALARLLKYKIAIIPVHWVNKPGSRVKFSAYFEVLWETIKIRKEIKKLKHQTTS